MVRAFSFLLFGISWATASAQAIETAYRLQGAEVGRNTYQEHSDGSFESKTTINLGANKIVSSLKGKIAGKKIIQFHLEESAGPQSGTVTYSKGSLTYSSNGKPAPNPIPTQWDERALFSIYHPKVLGNLLTHAEPGKPLELKALDPNSLALKPITLTPKQESTMIDGKRMPMIRWTTTMLGVEIQLIEAPEKGLVGINIRTQQFSAVQVGSEGYLRDPMSAFPELSQPTFRNIETIALARVPMRDGESLATTIVKPKGEGKFPVVLMRTPYGRAGATITASFWAERGYALVSQDVRGRGESSGKWDPFMNETPDGFDTLEWLKSQPWCDGNVGMIGASYGGFVQWSAAVTHHPNLKCIIPQVSPPEPVRNIPWDHGIFLLGGNVWWSNLVTGKDFDPTQMSKPYPVEKFMAAPITRVDNAMFGKNIDFFDRWVGKPTMASWPGVFTLEQVGTVKIPVLHISGFWDGDGIGTKLHWEQLRKRGGNQWMIFGPWTHAFNTTTAVGGINYGSGAILDLDPVYLRFFDTHLKGKSVQWDREPRARMFFSGANAWLKLRDWPAPGSKRKTWRLGGGNASGFKSQGVLGTQHSGPQSDTYAYDPNVVGSGMKQMQVGNTEASLYIGLRQYKNGFALYRTPPFEKRTALSGPTECTLYVSTTAKDGNFHVLLGDEKPDGKIQLLGMPGNHRLTWTPTGMRKIKPGEIVKLTIKPWEFAHVFEKGSRLTLIILSDSFPSMARNPGTGEPDATATRFIKAKHTIHRSPKHPSSLSMATMEW